MDFITVDLPEEEIAPGPEAAECAHHARSLPALCRASSAKRPPCRKDSADRPNRGASVKSVNFDQPDPGRFVFPPHDSGVATGRERAHESRFQIVGWRNGR